MKIGHLEVITGGMYCGKSEELIRRLKRVELSGHKYLLFKPSIDNRYSYTDVVTHDKNNKMKAEVVDNANEILIKIDSTIDVVGIDEVQFFDKDILNIIKILINSGKRIICAGLDMYTTGKPFPIMAELLCKAKLIDKLHAICVDCGNDAMHSFKLNNNNHESIIDIGSDGKYVALCENCYHKRLTNNKKFYQLYNDGLIELDEIYDYISIWHITPTFEELHEFLGMTEKQYDEWFKNGNINKNEGIE